MAKAVKGAFKCPKCDRTFSMAAHLARHTSTMHGVRSLKKRRAGARAKVGRRMKKGRRRVAGRRGRPPAAVGRLRLRELSLEQLGEVIDAAREEARRKLAELQRAFG